MESRINILLTSVGRRTYLVKYFQDALGNSGEIHVANSSPVTPVFSQVKNAIVTPLIYDSSYIPFLLDYCKENKISAIISLFDIDLPVLSANKHLFEEIGTQVIVSDKDVIDICNDKWHTYCFCREHNLSVPKTYLSVDDVIYAVDNGDLKYPVVVKPRWGMGSIGVYFADNEDELRIFYHKVEQDILSTYLKYESSASVGEMVIVQEKLSGQEHGLDVINNLNGDYQNTIVKKKIAMRAGETDCAEIISNPKLQMLGDRLSSILHHVGNLDVDVYLVDDVPYILELNARFGGGYPFSHLAGVNLPLAIVKWLQGKPVESSLFSAETGILIHKDITLVKDSYIPTEKTTLAKGGESGIGKTNLPSFSSPIHKLNFTDGDNQYYMMRDDLLPFSFGGNKVRIAQKFYEDMVKKGCNCMVTYGNARSNLCRAVANICSIHNIPCKIVSPADDSGERINTNNSIMVKILGAEIIPCLKTNVADTVSSVLMDCEGAGLVPYYTHGDVFGKGNESVPVSAYVDAYKEILEYESGENTQFDYIFHASGTGMTQAGLICGALLNDDKRDIIGISVARDKDMGSKAIASYVSEYLKSRNFQSSVIEDCIKFTDEFVGEGYGKYTPEILNQIQLLLTSDGIACDPTYTGKAFWGMVNWCKNNSVKGKRILFIHTGGVPLFYDMIQSKNDDE